MILHDTMQGKRKKKLGHAEVRQVFIGERKGLFKKSSNLRYRKVEALYRATLPEVSQLLTFCHTGLISFSFPLSFGIVSSELIKNNLQIL